MFHPERKYILIPFCEGLSSICRNEILEEIEMGVNIITERVERLRDNKALLSKVKDNLETIKELLLEQEAQDAYEFSNWLKDKTDYRYYKDINNDIFIFNNQIYWANLGLNIGSEQELCRPVLVIQTSKESTVCSIIPLTLERLNDGRDYHVDLENGKSTALVEQVRVISKKRIYNYYYEKRKYAIITETDWKKINEQLGLLYILKPLYKKKN